MKERFLHILCRLILIVAACPIDASALVFTDVTICNEYNQKNGIATETERDRLGRETHKSIPIVTDYLGAPIQMYDEQGERTGIVRWMFTEKWITLRGVL